MMKKVLSPFLMPAIATLLFIAHADGQEKNMPTFADGHDKHAPTAGFSAKPASEHTAKANREAAKRLPYHDKTAFEEQARGLIAPFGDHDAGKIRIPFHDFLKGKEPRRSPRYDQSVHLPSGGNELSGTGSVQGR